LQFHNKWRFQLMGSRLWRRQTRWLKECCKLEIFVWSYWEVFWNCNAERKLYKSLLFSILYRGCWRAQYNINWTWLFTQELFCSYKRLADATPERFRCGNRQNLQRPQ
jgi:hypothetical protein